MSRLRSMREGSPDTSSSSSSIVTVAPATDPSPSPAAEPEIETVRSAASLVKSSIGARLKEARPEVSPWGMVMLRAESSTVSKWVPSVAPDPAPTSRFTVTGLCSA